MTFNNNQKPSVRAFKKARERRAFSFWRTRMTISIEKFLLERSRSSPSAASSFRQRNHSSLLAAEARQAANRGLRVFPAPALAADHNLLFSQATSEIFRLEELAAAYPHCGWRVAATDPAVLILRIDGNVGWGSVAALSRYDQEECLTLQMRRGDMTWALFIRPRRLAPPAAAAKKLADGLTILGGGDSFPIPPTAGCAWVNPFAELCAAPHWLLDLDTPDTTPGKAAPLPARPPRPVFCRRPARAEKPDWSVRKGHPACNQAGWRRGGYRIYRQR